MHYTLWERQWKHRKTLRGIAAKIPCAWGPGFITDPGLNADQKAAGLQKWIWENFQWTGTQGPGNEGKNDSVIDLWLWHKASKSPPEWACGPLSSLVVGFLGAVDVCGRRVQMNRTSDGQEDYGVEYWSDQSQSWVFMVPHLGLRFMAEGRLLSALGFAVSDRIGEPVTPVTVAGIGKPKFVEDKIGWNGYADFSAAPRVMGTNWIYAGGGDTIRPEHWNHYELMPPTGKAKPFDPEHLVPFHPKNVRKLMAPPELEP